MDPSKCCKVWPSIHRRPRFKAAMEHDKPPQEILDLKPKLDPTLAATIMKCLASDPNDRPSSTTHLLRMLRGVTREEAE